MLGIIRQTVEGMTREEKEALVFVELDGTANGPRNARGAGTLTWSAALDGVVVIPEAPLALVAVAQLARDHAPRQGVDVNGPAAKQDPIHLRLDLVVAGAERRPSCIAIAEFAGDDPLRKL